jgi:hypothetical protein
MEVSARYKVADLTGFVGQGKVRDVSVLLCSYRCCLFIELAIDISLIDAA